MKIVVTGNYGAGNMGDEMILEGLTETLKESVKKAEIKVLRGDEKFPSGIRSLIKSFLRRGKSPRKYINKCDWFILGGGGLFGGLSLKANIIWGIQAIMAYHYKKPVIMYGQSVGDLKGGFSKWLVKYIFQKAKLIAVRDAKSKKRLISLGITKKIYVIPDPAFAVRYRSKVKHTKTVLIALRRQQNTEKKFIKAVGEFIDWLIEKKKYKVKIINFQEPPSSDADEILHEKVLSEVKNRLKVEVVATPDNIKDLLDIVKKSSFLLGMRLHSIISAIITETPFLAVSYAPKVKDMLDYAGLKQYMLDKEEIESCIQLIGSAELIMKKSDEIRKDLKEINNLFHERRKKFIEEIFSKIFLT